MEKITKQEMANLRNTLISQYQLGEEFKQKQANSFRNTSECEEALKLVQVRVSEIEEKLAQEQAELDKQLNDEKAEIAPVKKIRKVRVHKSPEKVSFCRSDLLREILNDLKPGASVSINTVAWHLIYPNKECLTLFRILCDPARIKTPLVGFDYDKNKKHFYRALQA